MDHFWHFQYAASFARNVECDFLGDFQTLCFIETHTYKYKITTNVWLKVLDEKRETEGKIG